MHKAADSRVADAPPLRGVFVSVRPVPGRSRRWAALGAAVVLLAPPCLAKDASLEVELAPYAWLAGVDGDVSVAGRSASFDDSFSDLISDVDAGAMGMGAVRYGRLVVFGQFDYIDLSSDAEITGDLGPEGLPVGTKVDGDVETTIATGAVGWRFDLFRRHEVDLLLGVRRLDMDVRLKGERDSSSASDNITDTIIMVSPTFHLSGKWFVRALISYGIAGDSDTTWELQPHVHYRLTPRVTLGLGYRRLHYDISSGEKGTVQYQEFDADLHGLLFGVAWRIGGE